MKLTSFSDYTLRVLMFLAMDRSRLATIPEIAAAYGISENHLMKVVHQLARSGVIESVRGKGGGIRLARDPENIRLGQIVRTSEGGGPIVECLSDDPGACRIAPVCQLTAVLVRAFDALYASLDEYTLADLVRRLGRVYEVAGRFDDALHLYTTLEKLGEERGSATLELEGLMPQAALYLTPTPYRDAGQGCGLAERILTLAGQTGRRDAEAVGHWAFQLYYVNIMSDPARAVSEGEQALALAREENLQELEAFVINDIGRAYAAAGRIDDAFASFEQAYERWRALGNEPMMADALAVWAHGLWLRGDLSGAEQAAREGLAIGRRIGNLWSQAYNGYPLGLVLLDLGRVNEAMHTLLSAADAAIQGNFHGPEAMIALTLRWEFGWLGLPYFLDERLKGLFPTDNHLHNLTPFWQAFDAYYTGDAVAAYEAMAQVELPPMVTAGHEGAFLPLVISHLSLANGHPEAALAVIDATMQEMAAAGFNALSADYLTARGIALAAMVRASEARDAWRAALAEARRQGARRSEWPALVQMANTEDDPAVAAEYRREAATAIRFLAEYLDEPELRAAFLALPEVRRVLAAVADE